MILYFFIIVACYAALSLQGFPHFADDPGVGWHLKSGEFILHHGMITTDPFLSVPRPWISDQWLSDVVLFLAQKNFGWEGAYLLLTIIFMSCFWLILFNAALKFDAGQQVKSSTALGVTLALVMCSRAAMMHFIFRPVIFSFLFFTLLFCSLLRIANRAEVKRKSFLLFPLGFCLWANIHPSFILGLILIGLLTAATIIGKFFLTASERESAAQFHTSPAYITQLLLLFVVSLLATIANPYGYHLHESIFQLGGSEYFMKLNNEWHPLKINSSEGHVVTFIIASLIFWCAIFGRLSRAIVFSVMTILFFVYQSFVSIRFLPYLAISAAPLLAVAYSELHARFFRAAVFPFFGSVKKVFPVVFIPVLVFLVFKGQLLGARKSTLGIPRLDNALKAIAVHAIDKPEAIYNHPNYGGRLTYFCGGLCKPVLDDRNTMLGEDAYKEFLGIKTWDEARLILNQKHARFLFTRSKNLPVGPNPLKEIYSEEDFKIFIRD